MPLPIRPLHDQEQVGSRLFDSPQSAEGISQMQEFFMGAPPKREASKKHSAQTLEMLETIYNAPDEEISLANSVLAGRGVENSEVFRVPRSVSDYELIGLKTSGMVSGSGRSVSLTQAGKVALRDKWLGNENAFKQAKTKKQYIHPDNPRAIRETRAASPSGSMKLAQFEEEITFPDNFSGSLDSGAPPEEMPDFSYAPEEKLMREWVDKSLAPDEADYAHGKMSGETGSHKLDAAQREFLDELLRNQQGKFAAIKEETIRAGKSVSGRFKK